MVTLLTQAQNSESNVHLALTDYQSAISHRAVEFAALPKFGTRMMGSLVASGASPETVTYARAMQRKLSSYHAFKPVVAPPASAEVAAAPVEVTTRGKHGKDYSSITGYFEKMIATFAAEPNYQPNEADLQVPALRMKLEELRTLNRVVLRSAEQLRVARSQRDVLLFTSSDSIYKVGTMAKGYVKSLYGYKGDTNIAIRKISFTKKTL
jgi:hypothetical protein